MRSETALLYGVVQKGFTDKMALEENSEGGEPCIPGKVCAVGVCVFRVFKECLLWL